MPSIVAPPDAILTQTPTAKALDAYKHKHIRDICDCAFHNDEFNHCAHFVGHAMGFHFGYTCKNQTGKGKKGASIRVHELFSKCPEVGEWSKCTADSCLVFVTASSNVNLTKQEMANVPRKHVGILLNGTIYHYSNSRHQVVTRTPQEFAHHYPGSNIALYYGTFPS